MVDREKRNAYMRAYRAKVGIHANRRFRAIEYLGGRCVDCGMTSALEFDHLRDKTVPISQLLSGTAWNKVTAELDKCVLRCVACHAHWTAFRKLDNINLLGNPISR